MLLQCVQEKADLIEEKYACLKAVSCNEFGSCLLGILVAI